jgi:hypothetical protein
LKLPGVSNAWTMPVKARTAMLATGMRTPVGLKITGADLPEIDRDRRRGARPPADGAGHAERLRRARPAAATSSTSIGSASELAASD